MVSGYQSWLKIESLTGTLTHCSFLQTPLRMGSGLLPGDTAWRSLPSSLPQTQLRWDPQPACQEDRVGW